MLAAVSYDNDRFEGLRDYIVGNKRAPPNVPGASSKPRLEARPGSDVPGPRSKIPTSSQRPGKQTNQHIVYGRVVFTDFHASAANPSDIFPGDVVLVHKTKFALGHDTNRATKTASFRQINAVLDGLTKDTVLYNAHRSEILEAREKVLRGLKESRKLLEDEVAFIRDRTRLAPNKSISGALDRNKDEISFLESETKKLKDRDADARFIPVYDWAAVPFLSDWLPDGVLLSRDDDEFNADYFQRGGGDSGTVMNVVVQGPTFCRNAKTSNMEKTPHEFAQLFDPEPRVRDQIFLLLLCVEVLDDANKFQSYAFTYKPTSARILEELGRKTQNGTFVWETKPDVPYPDMHGLTYNEATTVVAAWRIGTVMDNKATGMSEPKITINVNIEHVNPYDLSAKCGLHVGKLYGNWVLGAGREIGTPP